MGNQPKLRNKVPVPTAYQIPAQMIPSFTHSDFSELSLGGSAASLLSSDDYGVTVYNLGECEYPEGLLDGEDSMHCGYYAVMEIGEPVTITAKQGLFSKTSTSYLIRVETNYPTFAHKFSAVRRAYEDFAFLRDQLVRNHRDRGVPSLPPSTLIHRYSSSFIQERCKGLSIFLQRILENPTFLKDAYLLFFLQSDFSCKEIADLIKNSPVNPLLTVPLQRPTLITPLRKDSSPELMYERSQAAESAALTNSLEEAEDTEEEEEGLDLEARKSLLSSTPSEESDLGKGLLKPMSQPILILKKRVRGDSSSEGDSGHFEGSSSPPSSFGSLRENMPGSHKMNKYALGLREEEEVPAGERSDNILMYSPIACYMMP